MTQLKTEPRPAATLLLLREFEGEGPGSPEVFMLQRTSKAAFLPGAPDVGWFSAQGSFIEVSLFHAGYYTLRGCGERLAWIRLAAGNFP